MRSISLPRWIRLCVVPIALLSGIWFCAWLVLKNAEQSAKDECRMHLRSLSFAVENARNFRGWFPAGVINNPDLPPERRWSWLAELWLWLDGNPPGIPNIELPWDDEVNISLTYFDKITGMKTKIEDDSYSVFLCPCARQRADAKGYGLTSYVGVAGLGIDAPWLPVENRRAGIFGYREGTRTDQVRDGLSSTAMIIETASRIGPWRAAGASTMRGLDQARKPYIGAGRQFGRLHPNGLFVAFADGSVRFVSDQVDPAVFEAMSTIAGGEPQKTP